MFAPSRSRCIQLVRRCTRRSQANRCLLGTLPIEEAEIRKKYGIAEEFVNRNPRNLELMSLAFKRKGWRFQAPRRDFYHKLSFIRGKYMSAEVTHYSGEVIISASTKEEAIKNHLTNTEGATAPAVLGKVIASRCIRSGIESVLFDSDSSSSGELVEKFKESALETGLDLEEPEENPYGPDHIGIDYSKRS